MRRGLLTGKQWYETQAYRALNQALGRCLRHKQDWGAIIMVDERFTQQVGLQYPLCVNERVLFLQNGDNPYIRNISKWIRKLHTPYNGFDEFVSDLSAFVERLQLDDRENNRVHVSWGIL